MIFGIAFSGVRASDEETYFSWSNFNTSILGPFLYLWFLFAPDGWTARALVCLFSPELGMLWASLSDTLVDDSSFSRVWSFSSRWCTSLVESLEVKNIEVQVRFHTYSRV